MKIESMLEEYLAKKAQSDVDTGRNKRPASVEIAREWAEANSFLSQVRDGLV